MTVLARLVESQTDAAGYTTYVFECLDTEVRKRDMYVMCTRFPNWNHAKIEKGDTGYLDFTEIRAGTDKWFDGTAMIPYNYDMVQFVRFVPRKEEKKEYIMR